MTHDELKRALKTKTTVVWRGRGDNERIIGSVTGIIYRYSDGQMTVSAELMSYGCPHSVVICSPNEMEFWDPAADRVDKENDGEHK